MHPTTPRLASRFMPRLSAALASLLLTLALFDTVARLAEPAEGAPVLALQQTPAR